VRKKKGSEFPAGYKNPPRHTRFKPGQSGNPNGRPRKKVTLAESIERELNTRITVNEGGKQRRITKLDAIAKQQTNKAVNGDLKAAALLMKAIEPRESDTKDNLSPMLHAMRAIHAKHEVANRNGSSDVAGTLENDHKNSSNDPD
jgi:hypothetical protein